MTAVTISSFEEKKTAFKTNMIVTYRLIRKVDKHTHTQTLVRV